MCDRAAQLAEVLHRVCRFALTRGMTAEQRREIEAALDLARSALDGDQVDPVDELRQWCADNGHRIYAGDRVNTDTAAAIIGLCEGTLKNQRCIGSGLPYRRIGGRIFYDLKDIAKGNFR